MTENPLEDHEETFRERISAVAQAFPRDIARLICLYEIDQTWMIKQIRSDKGGVLQSEETLMWIGSSISGSHYFWIYRDEMITPINPKGCVMENGVPEPNSDSSRLMFYPIAPNKLRASNEFLWKKVSAKLEEMISRGLISA